MDDAFVFASSPSGSGPLTPEASPLFESDDCAGNLVPALPEPPRRSSLLSAAIAFASSLASRSSRLTTTARGSAGWSREKRRSFATVRCVTRVEPKCRALAVWRPREEQRLDRCGRVDEPSAFRRRVSSSITSSKAESANVTPVGSRVRSPGCGPNNEVAAVSICGAVAMSTSSTRPISRAWMSIEMSNVFCGRLLFEGLRHTSKVLPDASALPSMHPWSFAGAGVR